MHLEHIKQHHAYKPSLIVAFALSILIVVLTALLGRGKLNLSGALLLTEPKEVTVIALVEPKLAEGIHIADIVFLRKEKAATGDKPPYTYHVRTTDDSDYFARLTFDESSARWTLERFEKLHGSDDAMNPGTQN